MKISQHQEEVFWSKVAITEDHRECWPWIGAKKPKGYGNVRINKKYLLTHRIAFQLANGPIPSGLIVCHICDNPSCCNPAHLMLGTVKSNYLDMLIKKRDRPMKNRAFGIRNSNSKLTDSDVLSIRSSYKQGCLNQYELAKKFNVSQTTIGCVVRRETWRHV